MAILRNNAVRLPMWGTRLTFVAGQNPLGFQNASEALFTALLPSITNLTNHVRYYSLYSWLLDEYARSVRDTTIRHQQNFIRRAEVQIALLMRLHEKSVGSVPGSDHIDPWIEEVKRTGGVEFSLSSHADIGSNVRTYWQQQWGSFGTYYVGALQQLRLVVKGTDGIYRCTEEGSYIAGVTLAEAFRASTEGIARKEFLTNIDNGQVLLSQTEALHRTFSLKAITVDGAEHTALNALLIGPDNPLPDGADPALGSYRRRRTIRHVLRGLEHGKDITDPNEFAMEVYTEQGKLLGERDEVLTGWYLYMMNEFWHFGAGAMFYGLLERLRELASAVNLSSLVHEFTTDIHESIKLQYRVDALHTCAQLVELIDEDISDHESTILEALRSHDHRKASAAGWLMLISIFKEDGPDSDELFAPLRQLGGDRDGNVLEFIKYLRPRLSEPLAEVLQDFVLKYLVYHHQYVAVRKAGTGSLITLKFILEDQFIRHVETFSPNYTGSRLPALFNAFRDMGYLGGGNKLTEAGQALLKELLA